MRPPPRRSTQRTLNPRVRGSSPWRRTCSDLGFYRFRFFFCAPVLSLWLLRDCSRARTQQSGACQKRCVRRPMRGHAPRSRASTSGRPATPSLDQWSRPSRRSPGTYPESPEPMSSHSVRPAGNRHSCGDTPLALRARHAGLPARDGRGGGEAVPGDGAGGCLARSGESAGHFRLQTAPGTPGRACATPCRPSVPAGCGVSEPGRCS
jgi:hypothetical protein